MRYTSWTLYLFFFFNDTATTEIYTLSRHDALPIWRVHMVARRQGGVGRARRRDRVEVAVTVPRRVDLDALVADRKSTRLNSSHANISYAVFCLKKKKIP